MFIPHKDRSKIVNYFRTHTSCPKCKEMDFAGDDLPFYNEWTDEIRNASVACPFCGYKGTLKNLKPINKKLKYAVVMWGLWSGDEIIYTSNKKRKAMQVYKEKYDWIGMKTDIKVYFSVDGKETEVKYNGMSVKEMCSNFENNIKYLNKR